MGKKIEYKTVKIITKNVYGTQKIAENIGYKIKLPILIALTGDLGTGKTAFVQGLAKGIQVPEDYYIVSPTYTIINEYRGRLKLFHADFYRIEQDSQLEDIGFYEIAGKDGIIAVEWPEKLDFSVFKDYIKVNLEFAEKKDHRKIVITAAGMEGIKLIS